MEDLLSIGRFAAASRLSLKALRLYDDNGLLPPRLVDPDSGYRYYAAAQLRDATLIGLLRGAGMPLAEIRRFLGDQNAARLDEYELGLVAELDERRRVLAYVRRLLKEEQMYEVRTKRVDAQAYVSRMRELTVQDLESFIVETMGELTASHEPAGAGFSIYHGAVTEDENGPVEVGLPTLAGDKELAAGEVAFTTAVGEQCEFPQILGAYDAVAHWAQHHGRELDGPPREIYRFGDGETPRMEIAWPLR